MATKNIKGITIEIGGNTTKLEKALEGVDKQVYSLNSDLKSLNSALKLDPKNTELLAQKQDVLRRNIQATTERLNTLKEAQKQMGDYNSLTEDQKRNYNALSVEIAKSEAALKNMNKELKTSSGIDLSKLKEGLKKVGEVALDVSKKMLQVSGAIAGALAGVVAAGVKSYADLEQNLGGINKLFGDSADQVVEDAKRAYKESGVSANQYMETATSFSASLIKSLGGDTEAAAALTNRAINDIADNANTFGTSVDEVTNVYKALSKEQYQTLDNLKLGYAGTKEGMKQLIADAASYTEEQKELGITVDATDMSFDNQIKALSVVQKHLKISGTTADEAAHSISGSANAMKAAFDNFINGSGSPEALSESITTFLTNIGETITKLAPSILSGVVTLIQNLLPQIATLLINLVPQLLTAVSNMINMMLTQLTQNTDQIAMTISTLINQVIQFITQNLPLVVQAGITILLTLVQGIVDSIPTLAEAIPQLVTTIINVLIENIPAVLEAAITLLTALVEAIPVIVTALVENLPSIIDTIITTLIDNIPMLLDASIKLFMALVEAIPTIIVQLVKVIPTIITSIVKTLWNNKGKILEAGKNILLSIRDGIMNNLSQLMSKVKEIPGKLKDWLLEGISKIKDAGKNLINGMWEGIEEKWDALKDKVKKFGEGVVGKFKKVFGISSPSKIFKNEIGKFLADGISVGFTDEMDNVNKDMAKALSIDDLVSDYNSALNGLSAGVERSVNPVINPTINNEQNYQLMAEAMKEALKDMVIELNDRAVGKFIIDTVTEEVFS